MRELRRIGKRIAISVDNDLWLVLHLMIAGRLHWRKPEAKLGGRQMLAAFDFPKGSLVLTEAGARRRASLHVFRGEEDLLSVDPGGIDVFSADLESFRATLTRRKSNLEEGPNRSAIAEAGSAMRIPTRISCSSTIADFSYPQAQARRMGAAYAATRHTLELWMDRLKAEAKLAFPKKSPHFGREWQCMGATGRRVRAAAKRFSASAMLTTKRTIARNVRQTEKSWLTGVCRDWLGSDWPRTLDELEALKRR